MSDFNVKDFEEAAARFRDYYRGQNPPPHEPTLINFWRNFLVWTMLVIMIASFFLSATRTAPVFYHIAFGFVAPAVAMLEGFLAVIVVEGTAGAIAFHLVLEAYRNGDDPSNLRPYMIATVIFSMILGLVANIYATLDITSPIATLDITIAIFAGAIATIVLWLTGHILGVLYVRSLEEIKEARETYKQSILQWEEDYRQQWRSSKVQAKWVGMVNPAIRQTMYSDQRTLPQTIAPTIPMGMASTDRQTDRQTPRQMGFVSTVSTDGTLPEVQARVYRHLQENPADASLPARELALIVGVGKDSANIARNHFLADNTDK